MSTAILLKNGRVIDPASGFDGQADVLIEDGKIVQIAAGISAAAAQTIDASNKIVAPGFVDLHVHFREPGQEHKEDMESGGRSAAYGGFTSVCCMANTSPVNDNPIITDLIVRRAREVALTHVYPIGAATVGLEGRLLSEYGQMKKAGIVAVSDDGKCVMDAGVMRRALEYASTFGLPFIQHCEDHNLSQNGAMNEGLVSLTTGITSQPNQAESIIVARDVELVGLTRAKYHAAHLSAKESFPYIREAKRRGLPVTCEVTTHHFTLTEDACCAYDTAAKVNPPLRTKHDVQAVRDAIAEGLVDAIVTDHAPHSAADKNVEFGCAAFGICGLETALPLALELWRDGVISLIDVLALMTYKPAGVLNLPAGTLKEGGIADVVVFDPDQSWTVDPSQFKSKGKNTPFAGRTLRGKVKTTILAGRVVL